jgi:ATP-binding cassette, subfamily B, bacterial PglK
MMRLNNFKGLKNHNVIRLWGHLAPRRRLQLASLLFLMLLGSLSEVFTVGAIIPFLSVITNPEKVYASEYLSEFIQIAGVTAANQLVAPIAIIFVLSAIIAGAVRVLLVWVQTRLCFAIGSELSISVFNSVLHQPYSVHISRHSSEVISGITEKTNAVIYGFLMPCLATISAVLVLSAILLTLLFLEPLVTAYTFLCFSLIYFSLVFFTRKPLKGISATISYEHGKSIKLIQEGVGGIRDVLLDNSQGVFTHAYSVSDRKLRRAQADVSIISSVPRHALEAIGLAAIGALVGYLGTLEKGQGFLDFLPALGAIGLAAQRVLPLMQQIYANWAYVRSSANSLNDVLAFLQPFPSEQASRKINSSLVFKREIVLDNIWYRYSSKDADVFKGVSLRIPKGAIVGVVGRTGCGKSTLVDLLTALLIPTQGRLFVDNVLIQPSNMRDWQAHIAYVPQFIFISDSTVAENIAFGLDPHEIDMHRVERVAKIAQIDEVVQTLKFGYNTTLGESGVSLSGGQRQRIGIARALYKESSVLILDEATSALDEETEGAIMDALYFKGKSMTLIVISHRESTLRRCELIFSLKNQTLSQSTPTIGPLIT